MVADRQSDRRRQTQLTPLVNRVYRLKAVLLASNQCLCVVNKIPPFKKKNKPKNIQAWQFSSPRHKASESPGLKLGAVQCEKHHRMLVLMPALTVHRLPLMLLFSKGAAHDGLSLLAAFC